MREELNISPEMMGLILGGFFWTYAVMQLPMGYLVDRLGPRLMYTIAVAWWSVFTALMAVANSVTALFGYRLLLGAGEAGAYPSNAKVTALWFPRREWALATSIFDSGLRVGSLSLPVVTALIAWLGWRGSFIVTGLLGFVWIVFWLWLYRDPEKHSTVSQAELQYIHSDRAEEDVTEAEKGHVSWLDLFRYRTIWGMMIGFFCLNFVIYFFITWFPSYLLEARGFSLKQLGTLGVLPALAAIPGGWFGGFISDYLFRRGWSLTKARKTCLVTGMLLSSVIAFAAVVPSTGAALILLAISYASLAATGASIWSLPADVAPTKAHVASIGGIQNFASNVAGVVTAAFTGFMLGISGGSYLVPLAAAGGMCLLGAFSYLFIVGPIEPLPALRKAETGRARAQSAE